MKKIILSFALVVIAATSFAQHPIGNDSFNLQTVANSLGFFKSKGAIGSDSGFITARYIDTAAANLGNKLKNYPGALIRVGNSLWMRDSTAQYWIEMGTGTGSAGLSAIYAGNCLTKVDDSTLALDLTCIPLHDSDAFHTTEQITDSSFTIIRLDGTRDTVVISGISTGGGGSGITQITATNNYGQTWTISNPFGPTTNLSLVLDTTKYSTRANVDSKTVTLNAGNRISIPQTATQNLGAPPSWTINGSSAVDTIYRTPGKDSIQFTIDGRYHAIRDSIGAGGTGIANVYAPLIISGDTISRRFNVLHYGADPTGVVDATTSIQNAINAADAAGGGEVFFPLGTYKVSGAIKTTLSGASGSPNSQITIPFRDKSSTARCQIVLKGEVGPPAVPVGTGLSGWAAVMPYQTGVIIKSTITTGATGAAVIGTANNGTNVFNETTLKVEDIGIQVLNNPAGAGPVVGGISYKNGASLYTKNVAVFIDTSGFRSTLPTNDVSGIETPDVNSETLSNVENTLVLGFRKGYSVGEHTNFIQAQAMTCYYAFYMKTGFHNVTALRAGAFWCPYDIYVEGAVTFSNWHLDAEWQSIGKWYDDVNTIKDSANLGKGQIFYTIIEASVGVVNSHFSKSGGTSIYTLENAVGVAGINVSNIFSQIQKINLTSGGHGGDLQFLRSGTVKWTMGDDFTNANNNDWFLYDSANSKVKIYANIDGTLNLGGTAQTNSAAAISIDNSANVGMNNNDFYYKPSTSQLLIGATTSGYSGATMELKRANPWLSLNSSTSRQTVLAFQQNATTKWQVGMDFANNGTADFYIYDQANAKVREYINTTGDLYLGGTASGTTTATIGLPAAGGVKVQGTVIAGGTTGAQTINKPTGIVNFGIGAQTLVVTNSLATTSSLIFATILTDDATATGIQNVVRASGSFTIKLNATATAETAVCFWVINAQ